MKTVVFASESEYKHHLESLQLLQGVRFIVQRTRTSGSDGLDLKGHKIWFEDVGNPVGQGPDIPYDGSPYIILKNEVLECHQGPVRWSQKTPQSIDDHSNGNTRKRPMVQNSKKKDCPARVRIRTIARFPEFKINGHGSISKRRLASKRLRKQALEKEVKKEVSIIMSVPELEDHCDHVVGEMKKLRKVAPTTYQSPTSSPKQNKLVEI